MKMRITPLPILAAFCFALSGCGTKNTGLESVHQPQVSPVDYSIDLQTSGSGLAYGESERLAMWLGSLHPSYGDKIAVDDPSQNSDAARNAVQNHVQQYGLELSGASPVISGNIPAGSIRVVVSRMIAKVAGCPDWSRPSQPELQGSTMSNYGCATNRNLAAMIANPADLIQGRTGTAGTDPATSAKAVKLHRDQVLTGNKPLEAGPSKGDK